LSYQQLEARIARWAASRPDIKALVVVGSRARQDSSADEWSDLDLILFATNSAAYTSGADWLDMVGPIALSMLENPTGGNPEWFILTADGLRFDIMLAQVSEDADSLARILVSFPYQSVLRSGVRVLVPDEPLPEPYLTSSGLVQPAAHPSSAEFVGTIHHAFFDALRTAKYLRRGDLWRAKQAGDYELKQRLLQLLEWHARATQGLDHATWYHGRFLDRWADPEAVAALPAVFGRYDVEDQWQALFETLGLLRRLAAETAERLGYSYPYAAEAQVQDEIERMRAAQT
jgi:aminoglycoside 6-adenylyltransferase